jgi:hypothetical protein
MVHFNIILPLRLILLSGSSPSGFPTKLGMHFVLPHNFRPHLKTAFVSKLTVFQNDCYNQ